MKIWTSLLLVALLCSGAFGDTVTWQGDDITNPTLWSDGDNWDTGIVPTATQSVVFPALTGDCDIDAAAVCLTFTATNYTGALEFQANLTVSGSVTFGSGMKITAATATEQLIVNATGTLTWIDAGVFPCHLYMTSAAFTLASNWDVAQLTWNGGASVAGTKTISVRGNFTRSGVGGQSFGGANVTLIMTGTGAISFPTASTYFTGNLVINTTGDISWDALWFDSATLTITAVHDLTGARAINAFNATLDLNGETVGVVTAIINSNGTINVSTDFTCSSISSTTAATKTWAGVGRTITVTGNCTLYNNVGTVKFLLQGGTYLVNAVGYTANPIEIAGNVAFGATINLTRGSGNTGSLTFTSGTPTFVGSTIKVIESAGAAYPIVMNDAGNTLNALTIQDDAAISGTQDFSVATLTDTTAGTAISIKAAQNVTVTGALTLTGTSGSRISMASATPGSLAKFTLGTSATQSVSYVNATDIDSRDGQRIRYDPWSGTTLLRTYNWFNPAMSQQGQGTWGSAGAWGRSQTRWGRDR
jgi:hypothetical protein